MSHLPEGSISEAEDEDMLGIFRSLILSWRRGKQGGYNAMSTVLEC